MTTKIQRPKTTKGITEKRELQCGSFYVTVNGDGDGHNPIEVMVSLGKAGSCTKCQNEALTRAITLGLKWGIPACDFVEELRGLKCPSQYVGCPEEEQNLSCPDAIARVMERYIENCKV